MATGLIKLLGVKFGGATPEMFLPDDRFEELRSRAGSSRILLIAFPIALAAATAGLSWILLGLEGPPQDAVLDMRARWVVMGALGSSIFLVALAVLPLESRLLQRRLDIDREEYRSYMVTKTGWRPRRYAALHLVPGILMSAFLLWGTVTMGDRVDERGMTHRQGWERVTRSFDEVAAIEVYTAVDAPIGILQRPNLVVRFRDDSQWRYLPEGSALPMPDEVARYVAERSGIVVSRLGVRPR